MSDIETVTVKPKPTCLHKTKLRSLAWLKTLLMPVEYPVSESYGKGWEDPCNCLCGTLCFGPKAGLLFLAIPCFCCADIEEK